MSRAWLIIAGKDASAPGARYDLKPGLTMLGGARGDVPVPASGSDCVHLWSDPPKLIFVGAGDPPHVNGKPEFETTLHSGDRLEWRGFVATFDSEGEPPRLEEIPAAWLTPEVAAHAPASGEPPSDVAPWRWLKAGIVAEQALGDRDVLKRWQDASARGEFDPDAAARDLLASAPGLSDIDPRLTERSTGLMRELLMSSVTKRPARQVATAQHSGCSIAILQLVILVLLAAILVAGMLVARTRYHQSIDVFLDRIITRFY